LADLLEDEFHFAADGSRDTFVFTDGRYVRAADLLHEAARSLLENGDARKSWTISLPRELNAYLGARAPRLWSHPGDRYLNLTNGLLDLTSGTLLEHDPRHLSTVQLPVEFQPEARCPGWDEFVATTFPEDAQHVAYELVALTMVPNSACQRAVLLLGGGGNGKSRYLSGLQAFLGS
jgi:phage/plasmid-associated DNA primase